MPVTAYIALGSNLGDRQGYLNQAVQELKNRPGITEVRVSTFHETEPVGGPPGQGKYLNAAAEVQTELAPEQLLDALLEIEAHLGRVRRERYGPRTVDLDLLLYGDLSCAKADLTVPHPRLHERLFVLEPLAEIAPQAVHPVLSLTVQQLLRKLRAQLSLAQPSPAFSAQLPAARRELAGLQVLVTGSSSGIGRAIALELAAAGAAVVVHGHRSLPAVQEVADQVRSLGVQSHALLADLRQAAQCRWLVQQAWDQGQGVDIWINNAGADTLTGEALHWPFERKLEQLLAVDVTATMLLSRDVGQRMKTQRHGVIINMGWDQADTGMEGDSGQLFAAVKAAVMAFSKSLALSLAPEVRVNCVAPGWIRTAWGERASPTWQERVVKETPLARWGRPEDVAGAVRWLVSPAAGFVTGQVLRINGGAVR